MRPKPQTTDVAQYGACDSVCGIPFGKAYDWTAKENVEQYSFLVVTNGENYTHVSFKLKKPFCEMSDGLAIFSTQARQLVYIEIEKKVMVESLAKAMNNQELFRIAAKALSEKYAGGRVFDVTSVSERGGVCQVVGSKCAVTVGPPGAQRKIVLMNLAVEDKVRILGDRSHLLLKLAVEDLQERKAAEVMQRMNENNRVSMEADTL